MVLKDGSLHPRDAKMKLAREVTATFYGEDEADRAQEAFVSLFQKHDIPDEMPDAVIARRPIPTGYSGCQQPGGFKKRRPTFG